MIIMMMMLWTIIHDDPNTPPWSVPAVVRPSHNIGARMKFPHTAARCSQQLHTQAGSPADTSMVQISSLSSLSGVWDSPGLTWGDDEGPVCGPGYLSVSVPPAQSSGCPHRSQISDLSREKIVVSDVSRIPRVRQQLSSLRQGKRST